MRKIQLHSGAGGFLRGTGVLLTTLLGIMYGSWSVAQTNDGVRESGGLEEVVVTARKRVESAQDVPVSLTAFSAEMVDRYDLTSLEKLSNSTPEFNVGRASNGSGAQITLRGIGSQPTSIGLEQSTAIVVDGVYFGNGHVINEAFFDLERVELLKGPQALFFGKNATAGVVNITTAGPSDTWDGMVRAGYEVNADQPSGEAMITGPLSDTVSFRLAGRYSKMNGDLFNNIANPIDLVTLDLNTFASTTRTQQPSNGPFPGTEDLVLRGTLKWEATEQLTLTFKAGYNEVEDSSNAYNFVPTVCANPDNTSQTNALVTCSKSFNIHQPSAPAGFENGGIPGTRADGQPYNDYKSRTFTGIIDYDNDNFSFSSVTNYNKHRNRWGLGFNVESATAFTTSTENTSYWAFSTENRIESKFDGPFNVMLGAYYQKSKRDYFQNGIFAGFTDSSAPAGSENLTYSKVSETDGETVAGFGQITWDVADNLEVAVGARVTHETKDSFLNHPYIIGAFQFLFLQLDPTNPATEIIGDQSFNNTSPEATIRYKWSDDLMIYGAFKTAYKSGGFSGSAFIINGAPASNIAFEAEKARGFEAGFKSTLFDNQLRFNLNAYTYKFKNMQVDFFDSITFQFITTNAGSARTTGVETSFEYAPNSVQGLNLYGALNYNKARYLNFIAPCYGGQSIQAGCDTTLLGGFGQDLSGAPTAVAPKITAALGGNYEMPFMDKFTLSIGANGRYSGSYLGSSFGEPLSRNGNYINIDGSLRLLTNDGHWEFAIVGRNLTNNFHINGVLDAPNSGTGTGTANALPADILGFASNPRTVKLQLTWRY
jgi:iron complex outermembrane receptor protein